MTTRAEWSTEVTMIGASAAFLSARDLLARVSMRDATLLIQGETGTGKELAARAVHYGGPRRAGPFIPVNCGAIPDALVEGELFGYCQGAFTDAKRGSPGLLFLADSGSLFLDEVDALSQKAQVALLRFLQGRTVRALGAGQERRVDVRVIAASNRTLAGLVGDGSFRQDLFYRLNVMNVELPPLRERGNDVLLFAEHFLSVLGERYAEPVPRLDDESRAWLVEHSWPGNIRELENLIEREFLLNQARSVLRLSVLMDTLRPAANDGEECPGSWNYARAKAKVLHQFDRKFLDQLMRFSGGNVTAAARACGKERRDLSRLLRKYQVSPSAFRADPRR